MVQKEKNNMNARKCLNAFGLLVALSLMVAACQPQQPQATPAPIVVTSVVTQIVAGTPVEKVVEKLITPTPVPPTAVPAMSATPAPKPVDSLVIALQQEPDTLHLLVGSMSAKVYILNMIHVGCVIQNEKLDWIPAGCETVPTFENGGAKLVGEGDDKHTEITYKIRKDWRWTDGTPVTSKDIVYWWKLTMDPTFEYEGRPASEKIYDVVAVDDQTAIVKMLSKKQINEAVAGTLTGNVDFKAFQPDFEATYGKDWPYYAADPSYYAFMVGWMPSHILKDIPGDKQAESEFARKPVGDGPYVVKEWKAGQEIVLEKSDLPFPLGEPKVKTVTWRFIGETAGVLAALQSGEVDAATGNTSDVKVRQALAMALNRQQFSDTLYFSKKVIFDLPQPKGISWAYPPDSDITIYKYDPEGAKKLLAEAGWDCSTMPCTKQDKEGNTVRLEFTLMTTDRADRTRLAQMVQAMWKAINVGVNLQFLYGRGLFATCDAGGPMNCGTYDAAIYTFSSGDDATFYTLYSCAQIPSEVNNFSGQNWPQWCNQKAVDALNQSENNPEIAVSREKRLPYLKTFFQELTKDMPVIFLYGSSEPFPHLVNWKNFKPGPTQYTYWTWNSWEWEVSK
jgi:peptide/nickel transport system substrate-binding protein